jgi:hypothetical protein
MDKKHFPLKDNISQSGSLGFTSNAKFAKCNSTRRKSTTRGNDKVTVLIDGKQTALTGFGNQTGFINISH